MSRNFKKSSRFEVRSGCFSKKGINGRLQSSPSGDGVRHHAALRTLGRDPSAAEEAPELLEEPQFVNVLIDLEDGSNDEPTAVADSWMRPDAHTEAAFSIHESRYPVGVKHHLRSSLLIARTDRIVTTHVETLRRGCDMNEYRRILGCSSN
jgi:hypothetical protein